MAKVTRSSEEILPEDRVTNALIENKFDGFECSVEQRYENYGERGYADLVVKDRTFLGVIEIKSNPDRANKVIRQFNRMKENFIQGTSYSQKQSTNFYLYFTASNRSYEHIKNNKQMYESLSREKNVSIWIADEKSNQVQVFSPTEEFDSKEWIKTVNNHLEGINLNKQRLDCPYCGKQYKIESYYRKHVKQCDGGGEVQKLSGVKA